MSPQQTRALARALALVLAGEAGGEVVLHRPRCAVERGRTRCSCLPVTLRVGARA